MPTETMTPRERIKTALRNGCPDRVPATPDISIMIPTKRTGRPFWEAGRPTDVSVMTKPETNSHAFG